MKSVLFVFGILWLPLGVSAQVVGPSASYLDAMHTSRPICDSEKNDGVDFAIPVGTPVQATADGKVSKVWNDDQNGCGLTVILKHANGGFEGFAWLSAVNVKEGGEVKQGQAIALSGQSGNATSPKLHWTMFLPEGIKVDPRILQSSAGINPVTHTTVDDLQAALDHLKAMNLDPRAEEIAETYVRQQWAQNRQLAEMAYQDDLKQATDIWYANNGNYKRIPQNIWDKLRESDRYKFKQGLPGKKPSDVKSRAKQNR